jgi:hypothetical protein
MLILALRSCYSNCTTTPHWPRAQEVTHLPLSTGCSKRPNTICHHILEWRSGNANGMSSHSFKRRTNKPFFFQWERIFTLKFLLGYCVCALRGALEHCVRLICPVPVLHQLGQTAFCIPLFTACEFDCIVMITSFLLRSWMGKVGVQ